MKMLQPAGWPRAKGYSHGVETRGRMVFLAGLLGCDEQGTIVTPDLPGQFERILRNMLTLFAEAGAGPEHVARMTWYITDRRGYLDNLGQIGEIYRSVMGSVYPAMAVMEVVSLVDDDAVIEIEATAVIPD